LRSEIKRRGTRLCDRRHTVRKFSNRDRIG
jgi:hypothetical protein